MFSQVSVCPPGGTYVARGHAWQGASIAGGHPWQGVCVAGEMATAAGGTHPTGMHSCFFHFIPYFRVMSSKNMSRKEISHVRPGSHLHQ